MKRWSVGVLECWKTGRWEEWKVGRLEDWKGGRLEGWISGAFKRRGHRVLPFLHSSILPLFLLLFATGCMELETRIKLNEDGSAVVTERLEILRPLREIEAGMKQGGTTTFEALSSKQRAQQRAGEMGAGVTLVSHKVENGKAGSRRSVAVYRAPDLTKLRYMSPFFMRGEGLGKMGISIKPQYSDSWSQKAGILHLRFDHAKDGVKPTPLLAELTRASESPLVRQGYRDAAPIFRDLLKGFKVRVIFESYGEILGTGGHGNHWFAFKRPHEVNIVNYGYGGETGGKTGTHPLDDEEVMVDLMKLLLANPKDPWSRRKSEFLGKRTGRNIFYAILRPSRPLFDKYFKGKTLSFSQGHGRPMLKRMASFKEIGETPENQRQSKMKK